MHKCKMHHVYVSDVSEGLHVQLFLLYFAVGLYFSSTFGELKTLERHSLYTLDMLKMSFWPLSTNAKVVYCINRFN